MLYAKVVLGLPIDGPFDYSIPLSLSKKIKPGMRVWVELRNRRMLGYVVKVSPTTSIKNTKPLLDVIDESPLLGENMLLLARKLSDYYGCSWGEAIETALPDGVRKGRKIPEIRVKKNIGKPSGCQDVMLLHDPGGRLRWEVYLNAIKQALTDKESAIVLLPDVESVLEAKEIITTRLLGISAGLSYRKQPKETEEWVKTKNSDSSVILGTRSAVFAPVNNLGLVIIDEEGDSVYKQDQVPHYHARDLAFMRTDIEKAKLILGSASPSLETIFLAREGKIKYTFLTRQDNYPETKIIDMRNLPYKSKHGEIILSRYLQDCIVQALGEKGKILLFLNRRGFATFASCRHCGTALKCPRCNVNLVYYFKDNMLGCRYCNFKMLPQKICPNCNAGYIRYSGIGTEKIESELCRLFPQARIKRIDNLKDIDMQDADIFISTAVILKKKEYNFDLIGVLSIDNSLNRVDFRSTEKTLALLTKILGLAGKRLLIQTRLPKHYCLRALESNNMDIFYEEELGQRKQLGFPPYRHLCLLKLRGKNEERVKEITGDLFNRLSKSGKNNRALNFVSVNPGEPAKLRGNFYWQILAKGSSPVRMVKYLKLHLKNFSHSGIIVTIDMDPF
ncbi:MAG: primosomal protein N' [Candidatus Omnitrophica bacterium]|nr:primosomal protein N' [Candidatus Omnitrophota bacterium]MDD5591945.1 primosomal protein N' [Candidatus Omnitrophota bacterium]